MFNIKSAKHNHLLSSWSEHKDNKHGYLSSNNLSHSLIWSIEPGFHRHSVIIKDSSDRKLGIDHVNDSFNNIDIHLMKTSVHIASYSWFIKTNKYGSHHGLIFESMKNNHILSIDKDGNPYTIHKTLLNKQVDGWKFENIDYSDHDTHNKLVKEAKEKWHDNVVQL